MSRDNSRYKETYNRALDFVKNTAGEAELPSELELSEKWGSSRTTVRAVLSHLSETKIINWSGRKKTILRRPKSADYFPIEETTSASERLKTKFMQYILGGDLKPGSILRESELVREFGVSTSVIREFLIRFSRFGLIEKEPNRHWMLRGFTKDFAIELFDVREMFERSAIERFLALGAGSAAHQNVIALESAHVKIAENIEAEYLNFPRLDEQFHRTFINELDNRFVEDFFELMTVIFHYHYRWNKRDEKERNLVAAHQHLDVIRAVADRNLAKARETYEVHLQDARSTLLKSVSWDGGS